VINQLYNLRYNLQSNRVLSQAHNPLFNQAHNPLFNLHNNPPFNLQTSLLHNQVINQL
jgi:hypothetical protein